MTKQEETQEDDTHTAPSSSMIPLASTAAYLMEDYDFSVKGILDSIAKRAFQDRERSLDGGGASEEDVTSPPELPRMLQEPSSRKAAVEKLVEEGGAKWMQVKVINGKPVQRLADVSYGTESPMQSLDLYFPHEGGTTNTSNDTTSGGENRLLLEAGTPVEEQPTSGETDATDTSAKKLPVYIHIHGGGWSRGAKDSPFYGGPAMCQNAVADAGCIGVAIGYRLGRYPEFIHDAANAIRWVYDNIESLGGDIHNVFLSGHSAGGHISSLLILRHNTFLEPVGVPMSFFKGLVLVSGVYDLFNPMKMSCVDAKNKWFSIAYVLPAFGTDTNMKREASPLLLLDPEKDTSLMGTAMKAVTSNLPSLSLKKRFPRISLSRLLSSSIRSSSTVSTSTTTSEGELEEEEQQQPPPPPVEYRDGENDLPPPTLILNAVYDMGLQENGQLMAEAMSEYTSVRYQIIEGSDHASICWNEITSKVIADFVKMRMQVYPKKKRRGKRDKTPSPPPKAEANDH